MGLLEGSYLKMVLHGLTQELNVETDLLRSEYPLGGGGKGFFSVNAGGAAGRQSFSLQVPSNMAFHMRSLIINNHDTKGVMYFFDGAGVSAPAFNLILEQSTGDFFDNFAGFIFYSKPMVSYANSVVDGRIGGLIRERTAD